MKPLSTLLSLACVAAPLSAFAGDEVVPPNAFTIDPALSVHVSAEGLRAVGDSIGGVLPTSIAATGLSGEFDCDEEDPEILEYAADDIVVNLSTDAVDIVPSDGRLDINIGMTLWSDPADVVVSGSCVVTLDETCTISLPPTWLDVELAVDLQLVGGQIEAQVDHLWFTHGNFGNPVGTGCVLGDALETMQGYGVDLIGTILDSVLDEQIGELETQLEEALSGLTTALALTDSIDLLDTQLDYDIQATSLELSSTGLLLDFSSKFSAPQFGNCIPTDSGPYLASSHDAPPVTGLIPDTTVPYHFGIVVNEDMLNQAFYAAWQGGLLCLQLADLSDIEITTDYLGLVEEELVAELWPVSQALDVRINPAGPPRVEFADGPGFTAELFADVYGSELDRTTRFWSNGVYAAGGFGLDLEDGTLLIDLDFDLESNLGITVAYNEWLPSAIPEGFAALVPDLVSAAVDLDTLVPSFALPTIYGLGLSDLEMRVIDSEGDYLGLYAWIDPTAAEAIEIGPIDLAGVGCGDTGEGGEITIPGCEGDELGCGGDTGCGGDEGGGCGGCGDEEGGCGDSGCTHGGHIRVNAWTVLTLFVPLLMLSRRRR